MTSRTRDLILFVALFLFAVSAMYGLMEGLRLAHAEPPPLPPAYTDAARDVGRVAATDYSPCSDPDGKGPLPCGPILGTLPEVDSTDYYELAWQAARTNVPLAAVLLAFALVTLARRRFPPVREGTTGVVTATAAAALGVMAGGLLAGVDPATVIGWAVATVLGGKMVSMQPKAVAS